MSKLDFLTIILLPASLVVLCSFFVQLYIKLIQNSKLIDKPSKKINHKRPILKGAGLIVIPMIIFSTTLVFFLNNIITEKWIIFFLITLILTLVSFFDDVYNISSLLRLLVHSVCVLISIYFLTLDYQPSFALLERILHLGINQTLLEFFFIFFGAIFWIWIINLFNFMDGMDGITATQMCFFMFGVNILTFTEIESRELQILSLYIFIGFCGFFLHNKPPAKVFLGDSGSIPAGYLVGLILFKSALTFQVFFPLLILCMYFLLDSTVTLILRLAKKENIFQAHTSHFYQRMLRSGYSHSFVLRKIVILHFILLICSIFSIKFPIISLIMSVCATALILYYFSKKQASNE